MIFRYKLKFSETGWILRVMKEVRFAAKSLHDIILRDHLFALPILVALLLYKRFLYGVALNSNRIQKRTGN